MRTESILGQYQHTYTRNNKKMHGGEMTSLSVPHNHDYTSLRHCGNRCSNNPFSADSIFDPNTISYFFPIVMYYHSVVRINKSTIGSELLIWYHNRNSRTG